MSEENVESFERGLEAIRRRDIEAALEEADPEVELYPALMASVAGGATVYRGHEGLRKWYRESFEAFGEVETEFPDIRDLGDQLVALGQIRVRGVASGAPAESPFCYVVDYRNGKAIRFRTFLDPKLALEAAGLSE